MKTEHPHDLIEKGKKYDALKANHEELIIALNIFNQTLKDKGLINSVPLIESVLTKAKTL